LPPKRFGAWRIINRRRYVDFTEVTGTQTQMDTILLSAIIPVTTGIRFFLKPGLPLPRERRLVYSSA